MAMWQVFTRILPTSLEGEILLFDLNFFPVIEEWLEILIKDHFLDCGIGVRNDAELLQARGIIKARLHWRVKIFRPDIE